MSNFTRCYMLTRRTRHAPQNWRDSDILSSGWQATTRND